MGKGKGGGENSKKAAGNAKKAEAAAKKQAELDAKVEAEEQEAWSKGAKGKNAKKEEKAAKLEEAKKKKAEREAELEAEMATLPTKAAGNPKKATKASAPRGSGLDAALAASSGGSDLHAHNIDDAIAALELTTGKSSDKVDRHPERRFKAALRSYEEERLPEIRKEHPGLRLNQYHQRIYEEFKKSPDNPYNQVRVAFNASRDEVKETLDGVRQSKEDRLKR